MNTGSDRLSNPIINTPLNVDTSRSLSMSSRNEDLINLSSRASSPHPTSLYPRGQVRVSTSAQEPSLLDVDDVYKIQTPPQRWYTASEYARVSMQSNSSPSRPVSPSEGSGGMQCESCEGLVAETSFCNACQLSFCNKCWDKWPSHRKKKLGPGGIPHEKIDLLVVNRIKACLENPKGEEAQTVLHENDAFTTWFGIVRSNSGDILFEDFHRYASIIAEGTSCPGDSRYPGLISFVGATGAGKSTLIKILIEMANESNESFDTPLAGSSNENYNLPTSGDVHLYADPLTFHTKYPIMYADCEGLQGGERVPLGARTRHQPKSHQKRTNSFERKLRRLHHSSKREIMWADNAERRSREFTVKNLYPRLLYTFSDCIVFVLTNPRTAEDAITILIEWAAAAIETSTNQPILPHLIIVLNLSDNSVQNEKWDIDRAIDYITSIPLDAIKARPKLNSYLKFWEDRKYRIDSTLDLIKCYYRDVKVVRMPSGQLRPKLVHDQIKKLHNEIILACQRSRDEKFRVRMLLSADELLPYLQYAFDHFSSTLDQPFDFVKASFTRNAIPMDFSGSILRMAINIKDVWKDRLDFPHIFTELSTLIASCIMIDSTRHKLPGGADAIFPQYVNQCDDALDEFCSQYWPCEFMSTAGRCTNVRNGHTKSHQLSSGKLFAAGGYVSRFSADRYRNTWRSQIYRHLIALLQMHHDLMQVGFNQREKEHMACKIHQNSVLKPFFDHVGSPDLFISHSTCYACLIAPPEHPLPCGHVMCTPCLQSYGIWQSKTCIAVTQCPLPHGNAALWSDFQINLKPETAGVRILTLDGGGVKGIVELEILKLVEQALGGQIPLQLFFDLIVGTSAGGIIALGLGVEGWSVNECATEFEKFCKEAFTPRRLANFFGIGRLVKTSKSKYQTRPLQHVLQHAFRDERLFGGARDASTKRHQNKVAVITTTEVGLKPVVLANYNRVITDDNMAGDYILLRPENAEAEIKTWEAARATSAAPTYFKPFPHEPSKLVFLDGALLHNNPIEIAHIERRSIWPDLTHSQPDIILSVGSGASHPKRLENQKEKKKRGFVKNLEKLYQIAHDHIENSLNSEQIWNSFCSTYSLPEDEKFRFQRLNVYFPSDEAPKLDDIHSLPFLKKAVREQLVGNNQITAIANQLVANTFYYETLNLWKKSEDGLHTCHGVIKCRFAPRSKEMHFFSYHLQRLAMGPHKACFVVEEVYHECEAIQIPITQNTLNDMFHSGSFQQEVEIQLKNEFSSSMIRFNLSDVGTDNYGRSSTPKMGYPISGFPRKLFEDTSRPRFIRPALNGSYSVSRRTKSQRLRCEEDKWDPVMADSSIMKEEDPIARFSAPDYQVGGTTAQDLAELAETFRHGPGLFHNLDAVPHSIYGFGIAELE